MSNSDRARFYLIRNTIVAALGGLLFGFDTAVIAGTTRALTDTYQLTPGLLGITVSSALFGTVIGAMCAGIPSDRYGRRVALRALAVLYLVSAIGCALSRSANSGPTRRRASSIALSTSACVIVTSPDW